jgi:AhpD family alkylhydroperoxidase
MPPCGGDPGPIPGFDAGGQGDWDCGAQDSANPTTSMDMYNKDNLAQLKKIDGLAPDAMKAFWAFDKAALAEGAIPVKYKELIAVGVALTTQCPYCIDIHSGNARKAGASDAELAETAMVAAALRAGAAVTHATHAFLK